MRIDIRLTILLGTPQASCAPSVSLQKAFLSPQMLNGKQRTRRMEETTAARNTERKRPVLKSKKTSKIEPKTSPNPVWRNHHCSGRRAPYRGWGYLDTNTSFGVGALFRNCQRLLGFARGRRVLIPGSTELFGDSISPMSWGEPAPTP